MENNSQLAFDRQLSIFCQHAAEICTSKEFKRLNKEISKLYRKSGVSDFKVIAFHDSLYSLYLEQVNAQNIKSSPSPSFF